MVYSRLGILLKLHCIRPQTGVNLPTYLSPRHVVLLGHSLIHLRKKKTEDKEDNIDNSFGRLPNQTDITFVEPMASESSFPVVLSSKRQKAVTALPPVLFNVNDRHLNNTFDREFLKITLGKTLSHR